MKKFGYLALVLALLLGMAGCGSSEPEMGKVAPVETAAVTEAPEVEAPETEAAETDNPLSLGRMDGGVYTNTYAGFACELDESWTFYSAEELQELPEAVREAVDGSELGEGLEDVVQITDMMAENADLMANVNVLYNKQTLSERLAAQQYTEKEMIDITLEQQKDMLVEAYAQMGMETKSMEAEQVNFLGESRWALKTECESQGVACYFLQVFDYTVGAYGVTVTATSFVEDNTQTVLDLFYPVD